MKTPAIIIALLITLSVSASGQSKGQTNHITAFTKMWGFLKYYHPDAAQGKPDWDSVYVNSILTIKKYESDNLFNEFIIKSYQSLPKAKLNVVKSQPYGDSILRVFSEKDIRKLQVPEKLKAELLNLYRYHIPSSSKYINNKEQGYTYDHIFHNEDPLNKPDYPDEAHRLLALARFWNIVQFFYPHKAINARDWDKALSEFIPQFTGAKNAAEYREAFLRLAMRIRDSHIWFLQKDWNAQHADFMNMPFDLYYTGGKYIIGYSKYDSLMKANNFKIGDEIVAVNGIAVAQREQQMAPYTTGTNDAAYHRDLGRNLFRMDTVKTIKVTLRRNGQIIDTQVEMYTYGDLYQYRLSHRPQLWQDIGNGVFYVRFCEIGTTADLKKMFQAINKAKAVIWDMRDYPSFQMVQAMFAGLTANREKAEMDYEGVLECPGVFKANNTLITAAPDTLALPLYKGKLIVLVNEYTQSLAESVALEMRMRPHTLIMGRQTAGTTGNMIRIDIPGGIQGSYTAVKVVGVNGSFEEGKGVKIDKKIKLTGKKIRSTTDYMLEQAYQQALKE